MSKYKYYNDLAYATSVLRTVAVKKGQKQYVKVKEVRRQMLEDGKKKENAWRQKRQCKSYWKALMYVLS